MNGPDVEQAILSVKAGNIEEYRTIVVVFHPRLRAAIAGLCPPGVEAEEIAHCAFIEAYRRIDQYQSGTNFFAWLSTIARNLLLAEFEKIRRRARNKENYLGHVVVQQLDRAATEEPELLAVTAHFLAECLAQLKAEARSLLALRYREGWRVQAIAEHLARSASAISVQLFALRRLLRECVERKLAHGKRDSEPNQSHGPA
jgi:RNA polymerase sigma-70 factor (ECF subfamily)